MLSDEETVVVFADSLTGFDGLLKWCRNNTTGYRNVNVKDFTQSWTSGLALCALIHHFRPHLMWVALLSTVNCMYGRLVMLEGTGLVVQWLTLSVLKFYISKHFFFCLFCFTIVIKNLQLKEDALFLVIVYVFLYIIFSFISWRPKTCNIKFCNQKVFFSFVCLCQRTHTIIKG